MKIPIWWWRNSLDEETSDNRDVVISSTKINLIDVATRNFGELILLVLILLKSSHCELGEKKIRV